MAPQRPLLNGVYLLLILAGVAGVLTAALFMQFAMGETPCPLCLLQRVAMFGVCFGVMHGFRFGSTPRSAGISLGFSVLLLVVAGRQTLLDIYPRPGHAYVGSTVLGLHMPVWSVIVALALLAAYATKFVAFGAEETLDGSERAAKFVTRAAEVLTLYVVGVALINFAAVILQCGVGECHTSGYKLLPFFYAS